MALRNSGYERDDLDYYVEPAWCTEALLSVETFEPDIYDPACGCGTIPNVMLNHYKSHQVIATDIVRRGAKHFNGTLGFLKVREAREVGSVICNPPFRHAVEFIERGLAIASDKVAVIVPLSFLASQRRYPLHTGGHLRAVYILSNRASMPPGDEIKNGIKARNGSTDYCWCIYARKRQRMARIDFLLRPDGGGP